MDELTRTLQRCLRQHLPTAPEGEIDVTIELFLLGLDSMSAIALLLEVEEAFAITFPTGLLDPKVFRTGETLLAAVRELVASRSGAPKTA
ncbi:MAG: phosphopantetheine-binding protein [Gemmatimonadota bacterium]|nr:phosphopantetheine-binding protein [Gemmatimonadota bacterium]